MEEVKSVTVEMKYIDEFDTETTIKKVVSSEYMDLPAMEILHEIYKQFLFAAGFCVDISDNIILEK